MARVIGQKETLSTLRVNDHLSGSTLELSYRQPTTEEQTAYQNEVLQRKGRKIKMDQGNARLKYGLKILKGFRAGDFEREVTAGQVVPMASEEGHEHYFEGWKAELKRGAADIVMLLAAHVFEQSAEVDEDDEGEDLGK